MKVTGLLSLDRWDLAIRRLEAHVQHLTETIKTKVLPETVTVDSAELRLPRIETARSTVLDLIEQLDWAVLLHMQMRLHFDQAQYECGLRSLERRIEMVERIQVILAPLVEQAPSRMTVMQDLQHAVNSFGKLALAGESDSIRSERQRLRTLEFQMPIIGQEDLSHVRAALQQMNLALDDLQSRHRNLRATTTYALQVSEDQEPLYALMGIELFEQESPSREDATATAEQSPTDPVPVEADSAPEAETQGA